MRKLLHAAVLALVCTSSPAESAEPYLASPEGIKNNCKKPSVKIPNGVLSLFYPSDECGTIFVGPPSRIKADVAAEFTSVTDAQCAAITGLLSQKDKILGYREKLSQQILDGALTTAQIAEEKGKLAAAEEVVSDGLADDYNTFGSKTTLAVQQDWQLNVQAYANANPDYVVYPLYTSAGILTFEEELTPQTYEIYGAYDNKSKEPFIEYTVSGMSPLPADSILLDENKLPIFFPAARVDRANLKSIEFGGGGISASVTLNKAGYCSYKMKQGQTLATFLTPTVTYAMALKTTGSYTVNVKVSYLLEKLASLRKETTGTASALAIADDFFTERGSNTVDVILDNDLKNSISADKTDAFIQNVLVDIANQFLTAATGAAGEKRNVALPDVAAVEKYKTVQQTQRVCTRKSGFFGIGGSSSCFDQAYNIQVLQDTQQYQSIEATIKASFSGGGSTQIRSYILIPWNASL